MRGGEKEKGEEEKGGEREVGGEGGREVGGGGDIPSEWNLCLVKATFLVHPISPP